MSPKPALILILLLTIFTKIYPQNIFVANNGDDSNAGSIDQPLKTITAAINKILLGDTIFVRGGIFSHSSTISISSSKSGTESTKYFLFGYKNERPLLDFSSTSVGTKGIYLRANYWHIKGIDVTKAGHNGMGITGSNNIIEYCTFFENRNTGLQLDNGAAYNKIINCDSYFNYDDHKQGADADGFAPKLTVGTGNYFYGCRSWVNSDDGWDGYLRGANGVTTTLENCWTWGNGYTKTGYDPGAQANGNGFKMGGSDTKTLEHNFILKNCLAFDNKAKGFDQNSNKGSMTIFNGTSYRNKGNNYSISTTLNANQTAVITNCAALGPYGSIGSFPIQTTNSWLPPFEVTNDDFISVDTTGVRGPRKPDGSLPDVDFMHLAEGSDLINAGTNIGLPFVGSAPDLGAFEFGLTTGLESTEKNIPQTFSLCQNFPNPFNPNTIIKYSLPNDSKIVLEVFDLLGQRVATLVDEYKSAGEYSAMFNTAGISSGVYIYRIICNGKMLSKKMELIK